MSKSNKASKRETTPVAAAATTTTTTTTAASTTASTIPSTTAATTTGQSSQSCPQTDFPNHGTLVYPGDKLGKKTDGTVIGIGVHVIKDTVYASVLGPLVKSPIKIPSGDDSTMDDGAQNQGGDSNGSKNGQKGQTDPDISHQINQEIHYEYSVLSIKLQPALPVIGETVICRVTEIQPRQVIVEILFRESGRELLSECRGVIRSRDIRHLDTDAMITYDSFRPCDLIKANIISLGDVRSYYLSTAKSHLGVIYCENVDGVGMELIPPKDEFKTTALVHYMKCPVTGVLQPRKAALV